MARARGLRQDRRDRWRDGAGSRRMAASDPEATMRIEPLPSRPGLQVRHDDGGCVPIHPLWLRERCDGPEAMDPLNRQRLYNPNDLDPALRVTAAEETRPGLWRVRFSDGAEGRFVAARLLEEAGRDAARTGLPQRTAWDATLAPLPVLPWQGRPDGAALLRMVTTFLRLGFVILRGVPGTPGSVLDVARAFGLPRDTNFGVLFDVRSVPDASDLAYTGLALAPHTDNPYRDPVPGVQLLHCLANRSTGGKSTLVDGLAVALALRGRDPEAYRILSGTPVRFAYTHAETHLVDYAPMIEHDAGGQVVGIRFSPKLDFVPLLEEAALEAFYRARRTLNRLLVSDEFEIRFLLADGDLVMFDNRRLLHGRTAFDPQEGLRHLQGCYIDIDGPRSLYRVLVADGHGAVAAE
jgi:gamma-butyrobetaine dioxygenase